MNPQNNNMKQYIGTKIIQAIAMTLGAYNEKRGWTIPENEDPAREGYFIEYPDGYVSWSPKEVFEEAYVQTDNMNFGLAIEAMKKGFAVARTGWNGKGMYIAIQEGSEIEPHFARGGVAKFRASEYPVPDVIKIGAHIDMRAADGSVVVGWLASQTDMLANDWMIAAQEL